MKKQKQKIQFIFTMLLLISAQVHAQSIESLREQINAVIRTKNAKVGVAIQGAGLSDTLSIKGEERFPMQSVFKLPIAIATLADVDNGKLSLDQKIEISKAELLPGLWSPIREKYPEGATLTLAEIIQYTVSLSDNVGCDVLLRLLGGPLRVEQYFSQLGFDGIKIKINEETMQNNWDLQFQNWTTPKEANRILAYFYANAEKILSQDSYDFIWEILRSTRTGENRLRGKLPKETIVAHKTGWSGVHKETGVSAAVNDIGIIFIPNGKFFIISVFVTDSTESTEVNEEIIAKIAKLAWDYFISQRG